MIKLDDFIYTDADWDKIKGAVEKGLDGNADLIPYRLTGRIGGRERTALLTVRDRLESIAFAHIVRTAQASTEQRARIRQLKALEHSAIRFEEKIVASLSTDFSLPYGFGVYRQLQPGGVRDHWWSDSEALVGKFHKGHAKLGGRRKGGSQAQLNLKAAILGALEAVDGVEYLINVAKNDPRTFCTLLSRVLPMTVVGDPTEPIRYEVVLAFGQSEDDVPAQIAGAALDDNVVGAEIVRCAALPPPNGQSPHRYGAMR